MIADNFVEISQLLSKKDTAAWTAYWGITQNDDDIIIKNYPAYISSLVKLIIQSKTSGVFIVSKDRAYFLAAFLSALHAGVGVFITQSESPAVLKALLQPDDFLITDQQQLSQVSPNCIQMHDINFDTSDPISFASFNPDQAFVTFYTSGSTGNPKPIVKSIRQLDADIKNLHNLWGQKAGLFLSTVPHYHMYSLTFSLLWPVCAGYPLVRQTFYFWEELLSACKDHNYIISSPTHLSRLAGVEINLQQSLGHIFSAGAVLPHAAINDCRELLGVVPTEIYGSTETGGIAYRQQFKLSEPWSAFPNISLQLGPDNKLCIKSNTLPDENYYCTQDKVALESDTQFQLLGRADRIAKVEGKRICLLEIEEKLHMGGMFNKVIALQLKTEIRDELGIIATLSQMGQARMEKSGKIKFINESRQYLRTYFDAVAIPKKWRFVTAIPINEHGKSPQSLLKACFAAPE